MPDSDRAVLAEDRERWARLGKGAQLDEWLEFGSGLMIRRRLAMRLAHTNVPRGARYAAEFAKLMRRDGIDTRDKNTKMMMTHVLWLHDKPERLTILSERREAMTSGERARLNAPVSARQLVARVLKERAGNSATAAAPRDAAREAGRC